MSPGSSPILILLALALAGGLIAFADGWRLPLLALSAQYILVGALLSQAVPRDLALVKVVVGGLVGAILLVTKQWDWRIADCELRPPGPPILGGMGGRLSQFAPRPSPFEASKLNPRPRALARRLPILLLRALLLLALAVVSLILLALWQQRSPIPLPAPTGLAAVWLMGVGLLSLAWRRRPFHLGLGLLTLVTGFEVVYTSLEPGLMMAGLLAGLNITVSLAVATIETRLLSAEGER